MTDLTQLSDSDLVALRGGDLSKVSEAGLLALRGQSAPSREASAAERLKALQGGLYRGGVAGLLGLPMDTVQNVYNLAKAGVGTVANVAGRPDLAPGITQGTPLSSDWFAKQMERMGVNTQNPRPDDQASRMLFTGGAIAGGSAMPGMSPKAALAAAAGGATAGELSDNPLAVGLGAMAPAAVSQAGSAVRTAMAKPQDVAQNVETFKGAGVRPTVGMATENTSFRALENLVSKFPGGVGIFRRFAEDMQGKMGAKTATGASAESAGRAVERGVTGEGGFLDRTKTVWQGLEAKVNAKIPPDTGVAPTNAMSALNELATPRAGAEATTRALINPKIAQMRDALAADLQGNPQNGLPTRQTGTVSYEGLRDIRTRVGSMLEDSLVSGVPGGELKKLYGALSKDLEAAATAAGAGKEFARQNQYYSARMERIDNVLSRVIGKGRQPEDIFKAVMPTDPNQANKLRAVMRSLEPADRAVVTDAVVARLGKATPGRQNDVGDVFSSDTFLSNWNRLSPAAKTQLFPDAKMRGDLNDIASVASNLKEGAKVFANPSGTAATAAPQALVILGALGNLGVVGGIVGGTNAAARLLTSPKVVNWLAAAPKVQPGREAAHMVRLGTILNEEKDPEVKQAISGLITTLEQR